jgi:ABC-2 type transport system ATP-binding protein
MYSFALKCHDLSKDFWIKKSIFSMKERFNALKNLNLMINPGEAVAFLGPNGAGKSTTIKLLCGILNPTSGSSFIAGYPSGSIEANKRLGLLFGTRSNLWMYLTVKQSLEMLGVTYFLSSQEVLKRIQFLAELFEISRFLNTPPNTLSLGERMRCEIVASLIHKPSILLADEPTIGLDIVGKTRFRNLLKQWQQEEKATLLLTSHDISDVEALCQRAVLINKGQRCYDGPLMGLKGNLSSTRSIKLTLSKPILTTQLFSEGIRVTEDNNIIKKFQIDIDRLSITSAIDQFLGAYREHILDISVEEINLESIITQWYTRE